MDGTYGKVGEKNVHGLLAEKSKEMRLLR